MIKKASSSSRVEQTINNIKIFANTVSFLSNKLDTWLKRNDVAAKKPNSRMTKATASVPKRSAPKLQSSQQPPAPAISFRGYLPRPALQPHRQPLSGSSRRGRRDSTWQAYNAIKKHGLHALAVTFDQFDQTDLGTYNLDILKNIGVDHIHFSLNPNIVKLLVRKGLEEVRDPYWVNHVGIFTIPHQMAQRFEIPLVFYGENPQFEYGGPASSRQPKPMDKR